MRDEVDLLRVSCLPPAVPLIRRSPTREPWRQVSSRQGLSRHKRRSPRRGGSPPFIPRCLDGAFTPAPEARTATDECGALQLTCPREEAIRLPRKTGPAFVDLLEFVLDRARSLEGAYLTEQSERTEVGGSYVATRRS